MDHGFPRGRLERSRPGYRYNIVRIDHDHHRFWLSRLAIGLSVRTGAGTVAQSGAYVLVTYLGALVAARRGRAIKPTKPIPNRDTVAGSGGATDADAKLTLSRSAPIIARRVARENEACRGRFTNENRVIHDAAAYVGTAKNEGLVEQNPA
jgi:hypothetical protein